MFLIFDIFVSLPGVCVCMSSMCVCLCAMHMYVCVQSISNA